MTLDQYIENINNRYKLGNATEHTFRGDFQQLLESLVPDIRATNEPKRQSCGAPDYILTKKEIPVGFIEAKDMGDKDLEGAKKTGNKEQFDRYKASLNNLIFTDYLDFHLYRDGIFITKIAIAEITDKGIKPIPDNFSNFENLIKDFCSHVGQTIKSSKKLAEMMAGKARLLSDVIEKALTSDEAKQEDSTLKDQMNAFRQILIHDITPEGFADVYAQTIAYGMFAARLHDPTLPTFSRQEAAELIPKSNPFLRKLFGYIAGPDIDDRIKWIVDGLVEIFLACNVAEILKTYGKSTKMEDPIIHFYETFLSEYDPKLRKARGVWYTPHPVVSFQVRAIDDILKTEFGLPNGLADNSKIKIKVNIQGKEVEQEVHKVQLLDPATGTGTYIAEVIKHIYKKFEGQQGAWSNYVENHLLPRLIGFELLMASYAMAHLQIDLLLKDTGFKPTRDQRLKIYLTNSLEESHPDTGTLFANWLSSEANEANFVKRDAPVMIVMGNPPYSGESANKGDWIMGLMEDYKKEPGGKEKLKERNPKWINDDYVKFLRYGQHFIEKNGSGILAFINPHGFLDNPTFRGMRWNLLKTYDKIYTIDLHGNSKKKETALDGSADINVFDIMQGVSINIFVKTGKKKLDELGKVFHFDLFGKREMKYDFLIENSFNSIEFKELKNISPNYFFVDKNNDIQKFYENGFKLNELMKINVLGFQTHRDKFAIDTSFLKLTSRINDFIDTSIDDNELKRKYDINESKDWVLKNQREYLKSEKKLPDYISLISYRPFDNQYAILNKAICDRPRKEILQHVLNKENLCLLSSKQQAIEGFRHCFISKLPANDCVMSTTSREANQVFPLYLYPETNGQLTIDQTYTSTSSIQGRIPNLNLEIVSQIAEKLGLTFVPEKFPSSGGVAESRGGQNTGGVAESRGGQNTGGMAESQGGRNTKNYMDLPYNPNLKERAKELRQAGNLPEVLFWNQVKNKQFKGFDFDRQKIVGNYIVDFYCSNCNVVIEIDGSSHNDKQEYDAARDAFLESLGLTVIHIPVIEVMKNMGGVMEMLFNHPALKGTPPVEGNFAPIDILDYIYAVLHSPSYREKYKEFLKIDFPRVPYPKDATTFWQLVKLGGEIRQIHLLESPKVEKYITQYPIDGNNEVKKIRFEENYEIIKGDTTSNINPAYLMGRVYINENQFFQMVPLVAWEFYIGGYQPAQKWLKDRKGRKLEFEDIFHYQKIIVALTETDRLMKEIDLITLE